MKFPTRSFGSQRGNAMIEFALSAMVLTYALTGVFQFGYSMYLYNELQGAVRAGIRYGSVSQISNGGDGTQDASWQSKVQNVVVYGTPTPGNSPKPVIPNLGVGNVTATAAFDSAGGKTPLYVTVAVSSYSIDAVVKTFILTNKPSLTMPFMGNYCIVNGSGC
ncbi:MAG TPA: TadE/TadG family type IV pilus assembly protein [Bryobacteraceae bacterium]|jgi:Flp pilus assembly protein TadG